MAALTQQQIEHIAKLARLDLTAEWNPPTAAAAYLKSG